MERDVQHMKVGDIVRIIEACAKNRVSEFTLDNLSLTFTQKDPSEPEKLFDAGPTPSAAIPTSEQEDKDERDAHLLLNNPLEMEKRIADGELVDVEED